MLNRFVTGAALLLISLPLAACSSGDDDSGNGNTSSSWAGHKYMLTISKGDWATPRGVGTDLYGVAPAFLLDVEGSGTDLTANVGYGAATMLDADKNAVDLAASAIVQDTCGPTATATFSSSTAPKSTITVPHMKLHVVNTSQTPPLQVTADVFNLTLTDVLPNGSTPSTTGKLTATMDFKQLYILFASLGPTRTAQSVCDALSSHYTPSSCMEDSCKITCQPCPNAAAGDTPTCLTVEADGIGAVLADDHTVNTITSVDPTACADSPAPM